MEQSANLPPVGEQDPAFAAIIAAVERLDELGLADEHGRATVEPAPTFTWS